LNTREIITRPRKATQTMERPVTAPAEKETFKADGSPSLAAWVVLELVLVATLIAIQPAKADPHTRTTKAKAVCQLTWTP